MLFLRFSLGPDLGFALSIGGFGFYEDILQLLAL
jgi:hypothetical protein